MMECLTPFLTDHDCPRASFSACPAPGVQALLDGAGPCRYQAKRTGAASVELTKCSGFFHLTRAQLPTVAPELHLSDFFAAEGGGDKGQLPKVKPWPKKEMSITISEGTLQMMQRVADSEAVLQILDKLKVLSNHTRRCRQQPLNPRASSTIQPPLDPPTPQKIGPHCRPGLWPMTNFLWRLGTGVESKPSQTCTGSQCHQNTPLFLKIESRSSYFSFQQFHCRGQDGPVAIKSCCETVSSPPLPDTNTRSSVGCLAVF